MEGGLRHRVPDMVYGTAWKRERTEELVYQAILNGFRGIDTAAQPKHYEEDLVGAGMRRALQDGLVSRQDLYIQTKFTFPRGQDPDRMPYDPNSSLEEQIRTSVDSSLHNLRHSDTEAPYIDYLLLHTPAPQVTSTLEAWSVLESYVPHSIRALGICNSYRLDTLEILYNEAQVKPIVVQNRFCKETNYGQDIRTFCLSNNIVYQSFWTLTANPDLLASVPVDTIAKSLQISKPVALYGLVLGLGNVSVLNGTTRVERMVDDLVGLKAMQTWAGKNPQLLGELQAEFKDLLLV